VPLVTRARTVLTQRLSPEGTRRATLTERLTVCRLPWRWLVRFNGALAALGKLATGLWVALIALFVIGFDLSTTVERALNSGKPLQHAFVLAIVLPTLLFLLARSVIGWARWKFQRELWRRDVERLSQ
jgi:hypothetical protein